ncbi:MAG: YajQ family cyclic di-GMP-binding protein [bacterium]
MPAESSFDIRFVPNAAEVDNAWQQALKELASRYDFKGTRTTLELDKKTLAFTLQTEDDMKLRNLRDILERRLSGRGLPPAALTLKDPEPAAGGTVRQVLTVQQGLPEDKVKVIAAAVKETGLKVRTQIQGAEVRVFGKSKDDLQAVMAAMKQRNFGCAIDFGNYR